MQEELGFRFQTQSGNDLFEVSSAFQKSVRRAIEEEALHWAIELDLSGYGEYAWKRLRIMVSEDIGIAEPVLPSQVEALYRTWKDLKTKKDEGHKPERLPFVHAVLLAVRARKSRLVDNAVTVFYRQHPKKAVPNWAVDQHTMRGKSLGRGMEHFLTEGVMLENRGPVPDPYEAAAMEILSRTKDEQQPPSIPYSRRQM